MKWLAPMGALLLTGMLCGSVRSEAPLFAPTAGSPYATGSQPLDVVIADVDGDGHLDILTANAGSDDITVLVGDGRGEFLPSPQSPIPGGSAPHLIAAGDINSDGRPDVALTSHHSHDVSILLNTADRGFRPSPDSPVAALDSGQPHNHGLLLVDVNGDANLDIVTSNQNDNSISVLSGDGGGRFRPFRGSPFPVGKRPYPSAFGDLNGDGFVDIVTPNFGSGDVTVLFGDGAGDFSEDPHSPYRVGGVPYSAVAGDVNGDSLVDVVTADADGSFLMLFSGTGEGALAGPSRLAINARGSRLELADLNGDGRADLATGTAAGSVVVLLGDRPGGFRPAPGSPFRVGNGPWTLALADFDGDGHLDLVTANAGSDNVTVLLYQRSGQSPDR